jgi:ATP-dependent 26S proteasome regulatory subunit
MGDGDKDDEGEGSKAWRLLVLEDTGELLTPDAKSVIGQGLSRFLNVVDGLIGQGLRVLVLVTTNEPIKTLHPAVARPGRCAANIEFWPLSAEESSAWFEQHGSAERSDEALLLAELYARLEGRDVGSIPPAGFAG